MTSTLFDFDFSEQVDEMFSEEKVKEQFKILQQIAKKNRNGYMIYFENLPHNMMNYIDIFLEKGWIEHRNSGINILDRYLDYHTVEEAVLPYKKRVEVALNNPNVNWYENVLPVINSGATPIRVKDDETREEIKRQENEIIKEAAMRLGLKHFLEVPSARGQKINPFSIKWAKENVLPIIIKMIKPITDFDEMKKFFRSHVFFFGRMDWSYGESLISIAPRPDFRRLLPGSLEIASLCEATDDKTIELILDYSGMSFGHTERTDPNLKYVFPEGWSMERYYSSLTDEDKELIKKDDERRKSLLNKQ